MLTWTSNGGALLRITERKQFQNQADRYPLVRTCYTVSREPAVFYSVATTEPGAKTTSAQGLADAIERHLQRTP